MLSLADLTRARSKEVFLEQFLDGLKGLGIVNKSGTGAGAVNASGNPTSSASVVVEILTTGEPGVATFRYSLDGGATWSAGTVIPAGGFFPLPGTGITVQFEAAPAGAGTSFIDGDMYALELSTPNFPVTSWQPGSVPLTLAEVVAEALEDLARTHLAIAKGGLLDEAEGDWLTLLARNVYGLERKGAISARGTVVLTDAANAGPFNVAVGQLWVVSASGKRFTNRQAGILNPSGTLALEFAAESPGSSFNVGNGTIHTLATPLAGVTVDNPDPGSGTWLTTQGVDEEIDEDLRTRCKERWSALGIGATAEGYASWARSASPNVTRISVRVSPTIAGQVDVFLAGPSGAVDGPTVAAVDAYVQARVPLTSTAVVAAATNVLVTVEGTVTVAAAQLAAAQVEAAANLDEMFSTLGLGATVYVAEIIQRVMSAIGAKNFVLVQPAADVVLGPDEVATLTQALTWVAV